MPIFLFLGTTILGSGCAFLWHSARITRRYRRTETVPPPDVRALWLAAAQTLRVYGSPPLVRWTRALAPGYGAEAVGCRTIWLPAALPPPAPTHCRNVLLHESQHLRSGDGLWPFVLPFAALSAGAWHAMAWPLSVTAWILAWLAAFPLRRWSEYRADSAIVRAGDPAAFDAWLATQPAPAASRWARGFATHPAPAQRRTALAHALARRKAGARNR